MKHNKNIKTIDDYISGYPKKVQEILEAIRNTIKMATPEANEAIRYAMPTFRLKHNLVHFAAHKHHIGFYPSPSGVENFKEELKGYNISKGTIKFEFDKPIPHDLIHKIVSFRVLEENAKK
jgi:uncharacterized protein YdhG (YjbR/CyaY superfamily)